MPNALHSHATVCHYTPIDVIVRVRAALGSIDLDPASDEFGNASVQATKYFTEADDGLNKPWWGSVSEKVNVFCNPPGRSESNEGAAVWWKKAITEYHAANNLNLVFLGFSLELLQTAQNQGVPHPLLFTYCIPRQRLRFEVNARERLVQLEHAIGTTTDERKRHRLAIKRDEVISAIGAGQLRLPGDSPTHGNIIVCASRHARIRDSFRYQFSRLGFVGGN